MTLPFFGIRYPVYVSVRRAAPRRDIGQGNGVKGRSPACDIFETLKLALFISRLSIAAKTVRDVLLACLLACLPTTYHSQGANPVRMRESARQRPRVLPTR